MCMIKMNFDYIEYDTESSLSMYLFHIQLSHQKELSMLMHH